MKLVMALIFPIYEVFFFPKKQLEVSKATIFFSSPVVASLAIHGRKKLDSSKATILFPSSTLRTRHTK